MDQTAFTIIFAIVLVAVVIIGLVVHRSRISVLTQRYIDLQGKYDLMSGEFEQERQLLSQSRDENAEIKSQLISTNADLKHLREKYDAYLNDTERLNEKFELLAGKIIEEKTIKFDREQKKGLDEILKPLKEKIKHFEEKVEQTHKETIERHSSLKEQILGLKELNQKMTKEAVNLTRALKGDSKVQGNWGELILESILDKSGLEKDREYFVQQSFAGENGKRMRPDVIIHLPDAKKIIIDSKVSLTAYDSFVSSASEEEQSAAVKAHVLSIKQHIDSLSSKKYHEIYAIESPDFVLMFIPIDTAFSIALSKNPDLFNYAFDKNIVIVTPSTLLATLKTVETMWRNDKQQRYAIEIASEAGKMYDKFSLLVDDLISLGKRIDQTKEAYQESMKKLHYGKGDLITRAEKLKKLGAKANKDLPRSLIDRSNETNEN